MSISSRFPALGLGRRIIHTRPDGGVSITDLSERCYRAMCIGGGLRTSVARECEKAEQQGRDVDLARRWATALRDGGCSDGEAMDLFRRWCIPPDHGAVMLLSDEDLGEYIPPDRWFRDAWRRGHNGGPVWIDLSLARPIQRKRIQAGIDWENRRRAADLLPPVEIDLQAFRAATEAADSVERLRAIWPETT